MPQMLEKDMGSNYNNKLEGANERCVGLGLWRIYVFAEKKKNQKYEAFWAHRLLRIGFIFASVGVIVHQRGEMSNFKVRKHELLPSCPLCVRFQRVQSAVTWRWCAAVSRELVGGLAPGRSPWYRNLSAAAVNSDSSSVHSGYTEEEVSRDWGYVCESV